MTQSFIEPMREGAMDSGLLMLMEGAKRSVQAAAGVRPGLINVGTIAHTNGISHPTSRELMRRMLEAMEKMEALRKPLGRAYMGAMVRGLSIVQNQYLGDWQAPVRKHKKRRNQTLAYHRRVQKKWNKRFGLSDAMFVVGADLADPYSDRTVYASPRSIQKLKEAL